MAAEKLELPSEKTKIAILASHSGTTVEALLHGIQNGTLDAEVTLVISNNEHAGVFDKVDRFNSMGMRIGKRWIHAEDQPRGDQTRKEAQDILDEIQINGVTLVLLLGYMKRVVAPLLPPAIKSPETPVSENTKNTHNFVMLNNHPSIPADTPGMIGRDAQVRILELGLPNSAITTHFVEAEYDTGDIVAQHLVPVLPGDDADTLFAAVQASEKANIARDIDKFIKERLADELAKRR